MLEVSNNNNFALTFISVLGCFVFAVRKHYFFFNDPLVKILSESLNDLYFWSNNQLFYSFHAIHSQVKRSHELKSQMCVQTYLLLTQIFRATSPDLGKVDLKCHHEKKNSHRFSVQKINWA